MQRYDNVLLFETFQCIFEKPCAGYRQNEYRSRNYINQRAALILIHIVKVVAKSLLNVVLLDLGLCYGVTIVARIRTERVKGLGLSQRLM